MLAIYDVCMCACVYVCMFVTSYMHIVATDHNSFRVSSE